MWRGKVIFNFKVLGISLETSGKRMDGSKWGDGDYDRSLAVLIALNCSLSINSIHICSFKKYFLFQQKVSKVITGVIQFFVALPSNPNFFGSIWRVGGFLVNILHAALNGEFELLSQKLNLAFMTRDYLQRNIYYKCFMTIIVHKYLQAETRLGQQYAISS